MASLITTCPTCTTPETCDCFGSVASSMALARNAIQRASSSSALTYNILPKVVEIQSSLVAQRRHLHAYPELSYKEINTVQYLKQQVLKISEETGVHFEIEEGVDGTTGMWVDLTLGTGEGERICLRADMDALPILEAGDASYKSKNMGVHHACGHDCHMAILLGAIKILAAEKETLQGKVRFLFQPAEEGGGGAIRMIKGGCLNDQTRIFGLHVWNFMEAGLIGIAPGPITAYSDRIFIDIVGAGGHGSMPQGTVDAVLVAAHLVVALHSGVVSRSVNPFEAVALTVGRIEGGEVANAIAGRATLKGTVRTRNAKTKSTVVRRIQEICTGVGVTFGAEIKLEYRDGYPATISSERGAADVTEAALPIVGVENIVPPHPTLAGEDMSYYLNEIDGAFFFVGSAKDVDNVVPHHRADFDVDEKCLSVGASVMVNLIRNLCRKG